MNLLNDTLIINTGSLVIPQQGHLTSKLIHKRKRLTNILLKTERFKPSIGGNYEVKGIFTFVFSQISDTDTAIISPFQRRLLEIKSGFMDLQLGLTILG